MLLRSHSEFFRLYSPVTHMAVVGYRLVFKVQVCDDQFCAATETIAGDGAGDAMQSVLLQRSDQAGLPHRADRVAPLQGPRPQPALGACAQAS